MTMYAVLLLSHFQLHEVGEREGGEEGPCSRHIQIAELLTKRLGRKITHVKISEDELAAAMAGHGIPDDYARLLAQLDTAIKDGAEERLNNVVLDTTGREPRGFREFVEKRVDNGVWVKN